MFTRIGKVVSVIAVILGLAAIVASFVVAPDISSPEFSRASMAQSTLWLSQGAALVFSGLVLGVLCEISTKLDGWE